MPPSPPQPAPTSAPTVQAPIRQARLAHPLGRLLPLPRTLSWYLPDRLGNTSCSWGHLTASGHPCFSGQWVAAACRVGLCGVRCACGMHAWLARCPAAKELSQGYLRFVGRRQRGTQNGAAAADRQGVQENPHSRTAHWVQRTGPTHLLSFVGADLRSSMFATVARGCCLEPKGTIRFCVRVLCKSCISVQPRRPCYIRGQPKDHTR